VTDWWLTEMDRLVHGVGIVGMALIALSMAYSLRKRKWLVSQGRMSRWLTWHHWAGFIGGVLALGHTLGNLSSLGTLLIALLLLVLGSSGLFFLERRSRRPLQEATRELAGERDRRTGLDKAYRELHAAGRSGTPEGRGTYDGLMAQHARVQEMESRVAALREEGTSFAWWRYLHNVGTMMFIGVLLVHIWVALFFSGVGM
jgi:hypothetical protein